MSVIVPVLSLFLFIRLSVLEQTLEYYLSDSSASFVVFLLPGCLDLFFGNIFCRRDGAISDKKIIVANVLERQPASFLKFVIHILLRKCL